MWKYVLAGCVAPFVIAAVWLGTDRMGFGASLSESLQRDGSSELHALIRLMRDEPPDRSVDVEPGVHGHDLRGVGPEFHYYVAERDETVIARRTRAGLSTELVPVAVYDGPPRDVLPPWEVEALGARHGFILIRGRSQGGADTVTRLTIERIPSGPETSSWASYGMELGAIRARVEPGTYVVVVRGVRSGPMAVCAGETVICNLVASDVVEVAREFE